MQEEQAGGTMGRPVSREGFGMEWQKWEVIGSEYGGGCLSEEMSSILLCSFV